MQRDVVRPGGRDEQGCQPAESGRDVHLGARRARQAQERVRTCGHELQLISRGIAERRERHAVRPVACPGTGDFQIQGHAIQRVLHFVSRTVRDVLQRSEPEPLEVLVASVVVANGGQSLNSVSSGAAAMAT